MTHSEFFLLGNTELKFSGFVNDYGQVNALLRSHHDLIEKAFHVH